jgi:hypothetical protein
MRAHSARPLLLRHREVPAQIEQRDLPHLVPAALSAHQAIGEVRLPGGLVARGRTTDVHRTPEHRPEIQPGAAVTKNYGTTTDFLKRV